MKTFIALLVVLLVQTSVAVYCEASAYLGAGQPGRCTGQFLQQANMTRKGVSKCFPAINGACGIVSDQVDGCNCTINFFSGGDCNRTAAAWLSCHEVSAVTQVNFDHFNIRCT